MSALTLAYAMAVVIVLQELENLYYRFDRDYLEGELWERRWISWGNCISLYGGDPRYNHRYFSLLLPFKKIGIDCATREECWCQLVVHRFAGRWSYHWIPDAPNYR